MACGGLKVCERDIDQRLLSSHHAVRVVDFAIVVQSYVNTVSLKNGEKLSVKIGIHTGDVISGVVGETKPQFSLIGASVNKTSRVCSKCPKQKVLISNETHKELEENSNNFIFQPMKVKMKGITKLNELETVYIVSKRRTGPMKSYPANNNVQKGQILKNQSRDKADSGANKNKQHSSSKNGSHKRIRSSAHESVNFEENNQHINNGLEFSQRSVETYTDMHTERKLII